jgi:4-amino-4-deoxy-L-arabinose transferase-like glycosyltransferase
MNLISKKIFLILIIFLAAFLRLYRLGDYPPLNADEAAIGYNAWSLIQTGKDEHGEVWPLHFKSFGDYKPGGYFYIVLPFVKVLGLNEWAVRLPSALMGIATVYLVYLLAKTLWKDEFLGLVWAALLTISPWHIHFSRGGWESNVALFFITLGVYLFFKFKIQNEKFKMKNSKLLIVLNLSFVLALYTYHSARIVIPALVFGLAVFNWRFIWSRKEQLTLPVLVGILLVVPLIISFLKGGAAARFSGVGLFADKGPFWRVNELLNQHPKKDFPYIRLLHNKPIIYSLSFGEKYFSHFDGRFLFIDGDEVPRSKVPDMGVMYLFDAFFLSLGVWVWLRGKEKYKYLPFLWLAAAPLASAMTFQAPSALRALPMVVPLTFFVAYGIKILINSKQSLNSKFKILSFIFLLVFYLWGVGYWWNQYFIHYLKRYPSAWPDFRPVAHWLKENQDKYEKICLEGNFDQPYILTLFYLRYPPHKVQKEIKLTPPDKFGFSTVEHFGKYYFGDCQRLKDVKIVSR